MIYQHLYILRVLRTFSQILRRRSKTTAPLQVRPVPTLPPASCGFPMFSLSTKHQKTETHLIHHSPETTNETRTGLNLFIVVAVIRCLNLLCLPDIKSWFTTVCHCVSLVTASFFCLSEVTWARISKHFSWLELAPKMTAK